eukprot:m.110244 g.110244  ORF g.110244 m.110244 type:complete len:144 (-) comp13392_c0_seq1:409-840(-)
MADSTPTKQQSGSEYESDEDHVAHCRRASKEDAELLLQASAHLHGLFSEATNGVTAPADAEQQRLRRKKEGNRIAAKRCRERKKQRMVGLEAHVKQLQGQVGDLKAEVTALRSVMAECSECRHASLAIPRSEFVKEKKDATKQ